MDPMSDVLAGMQVRSFGYARLDAHAPWGLGYIKHSASFAMVQRGSCWLTTQDSEKPLKIEAGDCFLVANGDAHELRNAPDTPIRPFANIPLGPDRTATIPGNGPVTTLVGGWFLFDPLSSRPLTKLLPSIILIRHQEAAELGIDTTLQSLARETEHSAPGSQIVVNRLAEVLFIQMTRAFVASELNDRPGWLSALGDRQIGSALQCIHRDVGRHWTVAELADAVNLSRSGFAHRFRELVGEAPMEYLTSWRMFKACRMLRGSDRRLGQIAQLLGYESDAAFNRAFRRVIGQTPGEYRASRKERHPDP
jgi:AraC-like DNA-binding protein